MTDVPKAFSLQSLRTTTGLQRQNRLICTLCVAMLFCTSLPLIVLSMVAIVVWPSLMCKLSLDNRMTIHDHVLVSGFLTPAQREVCMAASPRAV